MEELYSSREWNETKTSLFQFMYYIDFGFLKKKNLEKNISKSRKEKKNPKLFWKFKRKKNAPTEDHAKNLAGKKIITVKHDKPKLGKLNAIITKNSHPENISMQNFRCELYPRSTTCSKLSLFNIGSNFLSPWCLAQLPWQFLQGQKLTSPTH